MEYPIEKEYSWTRSITSYEAASDRWLRLSSQLRLQQEVGERQFRAGGLGYETLREQGMVFVLTRTASVVHRAPRLDETITLTTWHRDTKGAQFYRCYTFADGNGRPLVESVSCFALVDPDTHRLLRPAVFERFGVAYQPERRNGCPDPEKLHLPEGLELMGVREVRWTDTDYNGHLNNTNYADVLCDYLPGGMNGKRVTGFSICFLREALEGDRLTVEAGERNGTVWMAATHARGRCFEARLTYERDEG